MKTVSDCKWAHEYFEMIEYDLKLDGGNISEFYGM